MKDTLHLSGQTGTTIKALRKKQKLTLHDLSEKTGISIGFLSKIERNLSTPSLNNLQRICYALNVTINDLAAPSSKKPAISPEPQKAIPTASPYLVPSNERELMYSLNNMIILESIYSQNANYKLDAMTLNGKKTEYVSSPHRYDELGIVTKGKMAIQLGTDTEYVLSEGDTLLIPAGTDHTVRNLTDGECFSFWFKIMEKPCGT